MFELRQYLLLFITVSIWGSGFVGQKLGISHISPFAFTFYRTLIGGLFLIPVIYSLNKINLKLSKGTKKNSPKMLLLG